jgi:DNA helicase-2/ATP-dependent DNA helicase PcrA
MNSPSRFIKEIPAELVDFKTAVDLPRFVAQNYSSGQSSWGQTSAGASKRGYDSDFEEQSFPDYEGSSTPSSIYSKGSRVRHPNFGVGTIYSVEGNGDAMKVSVMFTDKTIKKFVAKFARLEKV